MYLIIIVLGIYGEVFVRQRIIVTDHALATAAKYLIPSIQYYQPIMASLNAHAPNEENIK